MTADLQLPGQRELLVGDFVHLRSFRHDQAHYDLVRSVAQDPLIPNITTVPTADDASEHRAYVARQIGRSSEGAGYSFCIADRGTDLPIGQIGLWTREIAIGRA